MSAATQSRTENATRSAARQRRAAACAALAALFAASCLLTTSLDGLEGSSVSTDDGGSDSGAPDRSDAGDEAGAEGGYDANGESGLDGEVGVDVIDAGDSRDDATINDGSDDIADGAMVDGAPRVPTVVVRTGDALRGIAEHGDEIFWVQGSGIVRAPKAPDAGQLTFVDTVGNAFDVAVDNDYVYWSTGSGPLGNEVYRKPLGSTTPAGPAFFPGAGETLYLAVGNAGRVYVTGAKAITVAPRVDGGFSEAIYREQSGAAGIATDGRYLVWSLDSGIVRGGLAGPPPEPGSVYPGMPGEVAGIGMDGEEVFWIGGDGVVRASPILSPLPPTPREVCRRVEFADAEVDARPDGASAATFADVAVDDQWVYFTEPALRRISKCSKR